MPIHARYLILILFFVLFFVSIFTWLTSERKMCSSNTHLFSFCIFCHWPWHHLPVSLHPAPDLKPSHLDIPQTHFLWPTVYFLPVLQQGTYIQLEKISISLSLFSTGPFASFYSTACRWLLHHFLFFSFLVSNLITPISIISSENAFSSFSLSPMSPSSSFFHPWHIFLPCLLMPGRLRAHLLAVGHVFVWSLNTPFVPALQEFHMAVSLDALYILFLYTVMCYDCLY